MKKHYFLRVLKRLLIVIISIIIILLITDKIIYISNPSLAWVDEDNKIIDMNVQKMNNSSWDFDKVVAKYIDEGPLPPKGEKKRILIIGDSYVWPHGYSNLNHVWWKQLARVLYENGYTDVEVVAAGASGYSTEQEFYNVLMNSDAMKELDPDLIIVGYVTNDPELKDENGEQLLKQLKSNDLFIDTDSTYIKFIRNLYPSLYSKFMDQIVNKYKNEKWFIEKYGMYYNLWTYKIIQGDMANLYKYRVLAPLSHFIYNELDVPLFFVDLPGFPIHTPENDFFVPAFNEFFIPAYSMLDDFIKKYPNAEYSTQEWAINPVNGHPSIKATQFYADWTFNLLKKEYPEIIGKKDDNVETYFQINDWLPYKLNVSKLEENYYKFTYPEKNSDLSFLNLPINKDYVKLSLQFPINIKSIEITGDDIKNIELYVTIFDNEDGYDTQELHKLKKEKNSMKWILSGDDPITSINVSASIKSGKSTDMYIKVNY